MSKKMYAGLSYINKKHKKLEADNGQLTTVKGVTLLKGLSPLCS